MRSCQYLERGCSHEVLMRFGRRKPLWVINRACSAHFRWSGSLFYNPLNFAIRYLSGTDNTVYLKTDAKYRTCLLKIVCLNYHVTHNYICRRQNSIDWCFADIRHDFVIDVLFLSWVFSYYWSYKVCSQRSFCPFVLDCTKHNIWASSWENVSLGVSGQVRLKLACSATEDSIRLESLVTETRGITLSRQRITKVLIRLRGCAGWSAPLLFAYDVRHVFSWLGSYLVYLSCRAQPWK